jgi:NTE family protein
MSRRHKTVSLVLGSGGARGHAHIGVIKAIEERGLEISNIAGTSMGSVIGGIYAAGELDTYIEWVQRLDKKDVVKLLDLSFSTMSIFKGERIFEVLKDLIGDRDIEQLDRGFTAVAAAIEEQREVWLNKGSLFQAIRASTAVPGVFSPVKIEGRMLVDGGIVNPIPIAPTLSDATDLTIAVNLDSIVETYTPESEVPVRDDEEADGYRERIQQFLGDLIGSDDDAVATPDATDLLIKSVDVMQGAIARLKLAAYTPDMVIEIPRDACSFFEFDRASELTELGYKQTCKALAKLDT